MVTSKRVSLVLMALLLLVMSTAAIAQSKPRPAPLSYYAFRLFLGWYGGQQAWYVFFGSNDIKYANEFGHQSDLYYLVHTEFTLYPKLKSALAGGAPPVYLVTNYQQGPLFTAIPGQADYSSLWHVNLVTWKPGVTPRPIIDAADLPGPQEVDIVPIDVVLDLPIMATGGLGGPWLPAPPDRYRIKQALYVQLQVFTGEKVIILPGWPAYAQDEITRRIVVQHLVITDTADQSLAMHLGANYAPALDAVDDDNTQRVWYWRRNTIPPPTPTQYLVLEHTVVFNQLGYYWWRYGKTSAGAVNVNFDVSPVMDLQPVVRGTIPAYVTVSSPTVAQMLLSNGGLLNSGPPLRINSFLLPSLFDD